MEVRESGLTFATFDHVVSTEPGRTAETNPALTTRLRSMRIDTRAAGIRLYDLGEPGQGIVHVIGPELGITDRKSVVEGKRVSVRVDLGGGRIIKKKTKRTHTYKKKNRQT